MVWGVSEVISPMMVLKMPVSLAGPQRSELGTDLRCRQATAMRRSGKPLDLAWLGSTGTIPVIGTWRSLVARSVRDAEVVGSNPAVPTIKVLVRGLPMSLGQHLGRFIPPIARVQILEGSCSTRRVELRSGLSISCAAPEGKRSCEEHESDPRCNPLGFFVHGLPRFDDSYRRDLKVRLSLPGGIVVFPDSRDFDYRPAVSVTARRVEPYAKLGWHSDSDARVATHRPASASDRGAGVCIVVELGPHPSVVAEPVVSDEFPLDSDFGSEHGFRVGDQLRNRNLFGRRRAWNGEEQCGHDDKP